MREVWEVVSEAPANDECLPHLAGQHSTATPPVPVGSGTVLSSGIRALSLRGAHEARPKYRSATRPRLQSLLLTTPVIRRGFGVRIKPAPNLHSGTETERGFSRRVLTSPNKDPGQVGLTATRTHCC